MINFSHFIDALLVNKTTTSKSSKSDIAALVGLAQSDRERELIKCSIFQSIYSYSYSSPQKLWL